MTYFEEEAQNGGSSAWNVNESVDLGLTLASGVNSAFELGTGVGMHQMTKGGTAVRLAEKSCIPWR